MYSFFRDQAAPPPSLRTGLHSNEAVGKLGEGLLSQKNICWKCSFFPVSILCAVSWFHTAAGRLSFLRTPYEMQAVPTRIQIPPFSGTERTAKIPALANSLMLWYDHFIMTACRESALCRRKCIWDSGFRCYSRDDGRFLSAYGAEVRSPRTNGPGIPPAFQELYSRGFAGPSEPFPGQSVSDQPQHPMETDNGRNAVC